jgi:Putative zinc-finger
MGVGGAGQCAQVREELGVYVVGAIEPGDRARVDRHLRSCARCRDELAGLAGLPGLLRKIATDEAARAWMDDAAEPAAGPSPEALLARVRAIRRRRRLAAAVAAAVLAGVAGAGGLRAFAAQPAGPASVASPWTAMIDGSSPVTGAWAEVRYAARPWGTELEVQVTGIPAGTRCQLVVTGPRGQQVAAGGWIIAAGGPPAWYPASVPFRPVSLRGFAVTAGGATLITVPARAGRSQPGPAGRAAAAPACRAWGSACGANHERPDDLAVLGERTARTLREPG